MWRFIVGLLATVGSLPAVIEDPAVDLFTAKASLVASNLPGPREPAERAQRRDQQAGHDQHRDQRFDEREAAGVAVVRAGSRSCTSDRGHSNHGVVVPYTR